MHLIRKKGFRSIVGLALAALMMTTTAFAYELLPGQIANTITFTASSSFGSTSILHMRYAVAKWNNVADPILMYMSTGTHDNSTTYYVDDGNSYIYKESVSDNYVAQNRTRRTIIFGDVIESDININSSYNWANSAQPGCYDLYSVFLHEIGHTARLADLYLWSDDAKVMYGYVFTNTTKRDLTSDDIAGIEAKYN